MEACDVGKAARGLLIIFVVVASPAILGYPGAFPYNPFLLLNPNKTDIKFVNRMVGLVGLGKV